jgi:hypothetical protein
MQPQRPVAIDLAQSRIGRLAVIDRAPEVRTAAVGFIEYELEIERHFTNVFAERDRNTRRGQAATVLAYEWTENYERRNFGAFYNFHLRQTLENLRTARRF